MTAVMTDGAVSGRSRIKLGAGQETAIRIVGAAVHVLATLAVARSLTADATGIYFTGTVVALALAHFLKNKYEFYGAPYIASDRARTVGIPVGRLLAGLTRQMLIRAAVACSILLIFTSDLDILEPRLRPYLETYLPYVLSIPLLALSTLLSSFLRSSKRPALSVISGPFAVNLTLLLTVLAGAGVSLVVVSWAFFVGNIVAAALVSFLAWREFGDRNPEWMAKSREQRKACWATVQAEIAVNAGAARSQVVMLWGPLCLLAVLAAPAQFAVLAVAARTAQAIEMLQPSTFIACNTTSIFPNLFRSQNGQSGWIRALIAAVITSTALLAASLICLPLVLGLLGEPYQDNPTLFVVFLAAQWVNGVGRTSVRYFLAHWEFCQFRSMLDLSAVIAIAICAVGVGYLGILAAAIAVLAGALVINGLVTVRMIKETQGQTQSC